MQTMTERLTAQRILVRDMPDRSRVVATLRISRFGGNEFPHFSATGDLFEPHGTHSGAVRSRMGRESDACGQLHGEILKAFPGAAPFVAMHLASYPSGEPMHAEANGWHFLTGDAEAYELNHYGAEYVARLGAPVERCARALRLSPDEIPAGMSREEFTAFVESLRPRWANEAREARDLLERMPDVVNLRGYHVRGESIERLPLPGWLIGSDSDEIVNV